jgi:hypothetical protein
MALKTQACEVKRSGQNSQNQSTQPRANQNGCELFTAEKRIRVDVTQLRTRIKDN